MRKNLFDFDKGSVTVFSEPTTTLMFVASAQFVGESTLADWSVKPRVPAGHETIAELPTTLALSSGGG